MITLSGSNLHWPGNNAEEQRQDLCLHGNVFLKIDDHIISDEEWCVSAAALRFMRSLYNNHPSGEEQHMLPCCGHFMVAADDLQTVEIYGCCNGIDFDVLHENDSIIIRTTDKKTYTIPFNEYRATVVFFAQQVEDFYRNSPKRIVWDENLDKSAFKAFYNEWTCYKEAIKYCAPQHDSSTTMA